MMSEVFENEAWLRRRASQLIANGSVAARSQEEFIFRVKCKDSELVDSRRYPIPAYVTISADELWGICYCDQSSRWHSELPVAGMIGGEVRIGSFEALDAACETEETIRTREVAQGQFFRDYEQRLDSLSREVLETPTGVRSVTNGAQICSEIQRYIREGRKAFEAGDFARCAYLLMQAGRREAIRTPAIEHSRVPWNVCVADAIVHVTIQTREIPSKDKMIGWLIANGEAERVSNSEFRLWGKVVKRSSVQYVRENLPTATKCMLKRLEQEGGADTTLP